jgi:hypothetical protein
LLRAKTFECFRIHPSSNSNKSFRFLNRHREIAGFSAVRGPVVHRMIGQLNTIVHLHLLRWILIVIGHLLVVVATIHPSS